jgi:rhodanese-related sulfurtransferase
MTASTPLSIENLSPQEVLRLQNEDRILLIDVREPHEFEERRIPGAALRPLSTLNVDDLPRDERRRLVFQCGSGKRSRAAAEIFARASTGQAAHLEGGICAWSEAGYATICE